MLASRAVASQEIFVAVPVINRVDGALGEFGVQIGRALNERGEPVLLDLKIARSHIEAGPQRVADLPRRAESCMTGTMRSAYNPRGFTSRAITAQAAWPLALRSGG